MKLRLLVILIGSLGLLNTIFADTDSQQFYATPALAGDGIYSILRRYNLDEYSCNFAQFYKLNKLKRNSALIVGRKYYLPILVYEFNGKTIRSSIGVDNWTLAVSIQNYNEEMHSKKLRDKDFRDNKILWVPYHALNCPDQDLVIPTPIINNPEEDPGETGGNRVFPIFGKKYAYTPLQSNQLKGKVYYIVSGHGGPDPGAMGNRGRQTLCEDEYAYDVALRLCRNLIANGATAYMITRDNNDGIRSGKFLDCDSDEEVWGGKKILRSQKPRLFQRSDIVNELYEKHRLQGVVDQRLIAIHVDSRSHSERTDLFFYHHPSSSESRSLALHMHKMMKTKYRKYQNGRGYRGTVTGRDLHMLRETKPLSVYVELANIRNKADQQRIILESNRQYLANWLYEGLLTD